jgi:hypothetical protein
MSARAALGIVLHIGVGLAGGVAAAAPPPPPIAVSVDFNAATHPISPLIFGVSFGDAARNAAIGYPLVRWGGNSTTRYNWRGPAHNAAADYFFLGYGSDQTDDADGFLGAVLAAGAEPLLSVPTIGWVEKFDPAHPTDVHWGYSQIKYGAQTLDECRLYDPQPFWCHADAGNGECDGGNGTGYCVGGAIVGNDVADTSIANAPADDAAWIAHLRAAFGTAAAGGVKLFALDNEIMLWNSTHRDVHPLAVGYDEAWAATASYAAAIKQAEADAQVTGPVTWGYCDLFGSAQDNCVDGADRQEHGGLAFVAWYLQQVCANPLAGGVRAVDYLDVHYYPQDPNGSPTRIFSDADDAATAARRLKSLKELYDPTWVSNSWIADLGDTDANHYDKPALIRRVRAWIDQYCPGTRLAITEYNWGGDATASGAVAQAEALAIFAREGVDLAARWTAPAAGSGVEDAFRLFLDYDGAGARVTGDSAAASSASIDQIGAYAFRDYGHRHMVLLTNKDTSSRSVTITFAAAQSGSWRWYAFDASHALRELTGAVAGGNTLSIGALAPMSANLIVLDDNDGLFRDGFD